MLRGLASAIASFGLLALALVGDAGPANASASVVGGGSYACVTCSGSNIWSPTATVSIPAGTRYYVWHDWHINQGTVAIGDSSNGAGTCSVVRSPLLYGASTDHIALYTCPNPNGIVSGTTTFTWDIGATANARGSIVFYLTGATTFTADANNGTAGFAAANTPSSGVFPTYAGFTLNTQPAILVTLHVAGGGNSWVWTPNGSWSSVANGAGGGSPGSVPAMDVEFQNVVSTGAVTDAPSLASIGSGVATVTLQQGFDTSGAAVCVPNLPIMDVGQC